MRRAIRTLGQDTLIYGLAGGVARFVKVLLVPIVAKAYPAATYGVFDSLGVYAYLLVTLGVLGLDAAVALFPGTDGRSRSRAATTEGLLLTAGASGMLAILVILSRNFWDDLLLDGGPFASTIAWAGAGIPCGALLAFLLSLLKWEFRRGWYLVASLGSVVASIGLTWLVAYHSDYGLPGLFAATAIGQAAGAGLALVGCRGLFVRVRTFEWAMPMLRVGIPFAILGVAAAFAPSIDRFFVLRMHSLADAALYGVGQKIAALMALLLAGFQAAWAPFAVAHRNAPDRDSMFGRVLLLTIVGGACAATVLSLVAPRVAILIATPEYGRAGVVVPPLALSALLGAVYFIVSIGTFLEGRTSLNLLSYGAGVVMAIIINGVLVVTHPSLVGIAWANCAGQAVAVTVMSVLSHRVLPIAFPFGRSVLATLAGAVLAMGAAMLAPGLSLAQLAAALGGVGVLFAALSWWVVLPPTVRRNVGSRFLP
jgi:O-antigen/teichoic acid export membrane protein